MRLRGWLGLALLGLAGYGVVKRRPALAAISLLGAAACGSGPDYETSGGIAVFTNGLRYRKENVELMAEFLVDEFAAVLDLDPLEVGRKIGALTVVVEQPDGDDSRIDCRTTPGARCAGVLEGTEMRLAWRPCEFDTSFIHECVHYLLGEFTGDRDARHARTDGVWSLDGKLNSVVGSARLAACQSKS